MTLLWKWLLIVFAVSLDGFGVGFTYGLKKIKITLTTLVIVILCSGIVVGSAMVFGKIIIRIISPEYASYLGGIILICLGAYLFGSHVRTNQKEQKKQNGYSAILKDPLIVDKDESGSISAKEALILGFALALDAFGAGIGASMIGYPMLSTTVIIALSSGVFVFLGVKLGDFIANFLWFGRMIYFPPLLLIAIGIASFFK